MENSQQLIERYWKSCIEDNNTRNLIQFIFSINGTNYITKWDKNQWSYPEKIELITK